MQNPIKRIPYLGTPDTPLFSSTQDHLPISDVTRDLVLFKNGGAAMVLESTSLNFGLLSEREQEAVVAAFAALINSLSFSIQILVRTQKKDVTSYIARLDTEIPKVQNPKLKRLMIGYKAFISETIKKKNVLGKRFFIIIPFSPYEVGVSKSFKAASGKKGTLPFSKEYVIKKAEVSLYPKRDHLVRQARRLGLKISQLGNEEIIKLLINVYHPDPQAVAVNMEAHKEQ